MKTKLFILLITLMPFALQAQTATNSQPHQYTLTTPQKLSKLLIYPNPANTWFVVDNNDFDTLKMVIYNGLGQLVGSKTINQKLFRYNCSLLSSGMYILHFSAKGKSENKKIIIN